MEQEETLWSGKPKKGFQLVFEDLLIIPFMLFFCFVSYMIASNIKNNIVGILVALIIFLGIIYIGISRTL